MQVGETVRNPESVQYIKWLEQCWNEQVVRYFSLGIVSFVWLDKYDNESALYKAVCPYNKPNYFTFYQRIIDVGFHNKWWILSRHMQDYDVNTNELDDFSNVPYK